MITKSSVEKSFDGNAEFEDMSPEFTVTVSCEFDSPVEADKFVREVEGLVSKFRRRTALTKKLEEED